VETNPPDDIKAAVPEAPSDTPEPATPKPTRLPPRAAASGSPPSAPILRVTASSQIPANLPYDGLFAERVPLLQAFRFALANAMAFHSEALARDGAWRAAEAGVYRGRSLRALIETAELMGARVDFIGLDSFEGFPSLGEQDLRLATPNAKYVREQLFSDTTEREVVAYISDAAINCSFRLIKGFFSQALKTLPEATYFFVNIDCDLYDGHLQTLEYFYPRTLPGGIIFFDDYFSKEYPMAKAAVDEFMSDKPELVFSLRYGEASHALRKGFIVKTAD